MRKKGIRLDLKRFREDYNVSQKDIAEVLNRPQSFMSAIEHGKRPIPDFLLDELVNHFKVKNIDEYIVTPEEMATTNNENIHNAFINNQVDSPGARFFVGDDECLPSKKQTEQSNNEAPQSESNNFNQLIQLLSNSDKRYEEARREVEYLRNRVQELEEQLATFQRYTQQKTIK